MSTKFDKDRLKQLFADKRFMTLVSCAGACVILIVYYFIHRTDPGETVPVKPTNSLNADLPNAGDSTGLPSRSKLELATEGKPLAMPDPTADDGELNAQVPASIQPDRARRPEADSYIYGDAVPDEVYQEPQPDVAGARPKARTRKVASAQPDFAQFEEDEEEDPVKTKRELDKERKLLGLLQEYKADKLKRQQEWQNRALKPETIPVSTVSSLNGPTGKNSFYGLQSDMRKQLLDGKEDSLSVTVKAVVFSDQTIVSGGRVGLRLLENITLRGRMIPEGTRLYGIASFGGQRVNVIINQVQYEERILPVKLTVYDMDGLTGIYVPNVLAVEQGRQTVNQAAQGFNVNAPLNSTNAPALAAASALQAGIQGGRNFLSRKVAVQKATLKNNYYVLLK